MNGTSVEVTGGLGAFLALFFLAVAVIFLGYDLSKRLRRMDYQERLRVEEERLRQERRGQDADDGPAGGPDGGTDGGTGGDGLDSDRGNDRPDSGSTRGDGPTT